MTISKNARKLFPLLTISALLPLASANAALVHRYSLNGNGNDSVGTANGTLNNPGGTASFSSTALNTTNANATDFLSLPSSVGTGITGDFSIEDWLTQAGSETAYTSIFSFSTSTSNFILLNPNRNGTGTTADFDQPSVTNAGAGTEVNVNAPGTAFKVNGNFGTELQIVLTYVSSTGIASMYNDGTLLASGNVGTGFSFQAATNGSYDGIGGGDAYADPDFNGSTDDLRIYSQALTAAQISALETAGPNATTAQINNLVPEPASLAGIAGLGLLLNARRLRRH
ncbi:MAG TPA: LamG-like jellyroll fold domain-containing protein [Tepidisphaeraceae bacterium]